MNERAPTPANPLGPVTETIVVRRHASGAVTVEGSSKSKVVSFGMLQMAIQTIAGEKGPASPIVRV